MIYAVLHTIVYRTDSRGNSLGTIESFRLVDYPETEDLDKVGADIAAENRRSLSKHAAAISSRIVAREDQPPGKEVFRWSTQSMIHVSGCARWILDRYFHLNNLKRFKINGRAMSREIKSRQMTCPPDCNHANIQP